MDLKNNKITIGQLFDDERSRAVLFKYAPLFLKHPLLMTVRRMSLQEVVVKARRFVPSSQLDMILGELQNI